MKHIIFTAFLAGTKKSCIGWIHSEKQTNQSWALTCPSFICVCYSGMNYYLQYLNIGLAKVKYFKVSIIWRFVFRSCLYTQDYILCLNCKYLSDDFFVYRLEISCDNACHGCEVIVKLDLLPHHLKECEHNPKRPVTCTQGCGQTVAKDEMKVKLDLATC